VSKLIACLTGFLPAAALAAGPGLEYRFLVPVLLVPAILVMIAGAVLLLRGRRVWARIRDNEARYQVFYDLAPVAMVVHDQQHCITDWNRAAERLFGWSREQVLGRDFFDLLSSGDAVADLRGAVDQTLRTTMRSTTMNWSIRKDGQRVLCDWSNSVIKGGHGEVHAVVSLAVDVTAAREFERRLRDSERRFRSLAENAYDVIWTATLEGVITYASPSIERLAGYTPEQVIGRSLLDALAPDTAAEVHEALERLRTRGISPQRQWECRQFARDGRSIWVQVTMDVLRSDRGAPHGILGITRDVTEQRETQNALASRVTAIESAADGVIITDPDGRMEYVNPAYVALTGYSTERSLGKLPRPLLDDKHQPNERYREIFAVVHSGKVWRGEADRWHDTDPARVASLTVSPVMDEAGRLVRVVAIMRDISEHKAMEQRLTQMAHYDPLTGLPNRRLFFDRLQQRLQLGRRSNQPVALMFLDLDGFKAVNDSFGHAAGDQVLQQVAQRFSAVLRESDSFARVAGDEFAILLGPEGESFAPEQVAERLIACLSTPVQLATGLCRIGVSIGISRYPEDARDPETLLRYADQAMYVAKRAGRNRYCLHTDASEVSSATG